MDDGAAPVKFNFVEIAPRWEELVSGARNGEDASARYLLQRVVHELHYGYPLDPIVGDYLATALAQVVRAPGQAAQAFGLTPRRGAPTSNGALRQYTGHLVLSLHDKGLPLRDGRPTSVWDGAGAIARAIEILAADGIVVTESQARHGYEAANRWRARQRVNRERARVLNARFAESEDGDNATR